MTLRRIIRNHYYVDLRVKGTGKRIRRHLWSLYKPSGTGIR